MAGEQGLFKMGGEAALAEATLGQREDVSSSSGLSETSGKGGGDDEGSHCSSDIMLPADWSMAVLMHDWLSAT